MFSACMHMLNLEQVKRNNKYQILEDLYNNLGASEQK